MYRPQYTRASYRISERIRKQTEQQPLYLPHSAVESWEARIDALLSDSIRMEEDSIRKYNFLISEIKILPTDLATRARFVEILEHIKQQSVTHVGLLKRLRG